MRWEPGARGRLERAALELYGERGFEQTTVAGIAERAGLTERTFFRHFADKREVLFSGAAELQGFLVGRVEGAPAAQPALERVLAALVDAADEVFEERADFARRRQAIIAATAELRERELIKLARLADALADALRRGGVPDPTAGLAAEAGIAVFRVAFERWTAQAGDLPLAQVIRESSAALHAVTHEAGTAAQQTAGRPARAART